MSINWQKELRNFQIQEFLSKKKLEKTQFRKNCKPDEFLSKNSSGASIDEESDIPASSVEKQESSKNVNSSTKDFGDLINLNQNGAFSNSMLNKDYILEITTLDFHDLHNEKVKLGKNKRLVNSYLAGLVWCQSLKKD